MSRRQSALLTSAALLSAGLALIYQMAFAAPQPVPATAPVTPIYGLGHSEFCHVASPSCAASACHGGGIVGRKGSEQTTWSPDLLGKGPTDPHSRAFGVLFNAESLKMAKALNLNAPSKESRCLNCHADADAAPEHAAEGVGCGACHGPAEKWLAAHTRPTWKGLTNRDKWERYGFLPTADLVARNLACAKCHVGDAEREVDHDMIAAGHPRLAFESARFHFDPSYRKHWTEKGDAADFELRTWFVGQVVGVRAATELLRVRAERAGADPVKPWPEFAGSSCYSCHKTVGLPGDSPTASKPSKTLGIPAWESWSVSQADVVWELREDFYRGVELPERKEFAALRTLMEKRAPEPKAVAVQAKKALAELDGWLAAIQTSHDSGRLPRTATELPARLVGALARRALETTDWDALAGAYLGCATGYHASGGKARVPEWTEPIRALEAELKFPRDRGGTRFDGPADFGPSKRERLRKQFRLLVDATATRSEP